MPPCDRSQVVDRGLNPFSPQLQESGGAFSSLENSIQKVVPSLPLPSKQSKKSCAQKLMENTFIKKKSGVALKFPPGFFAEGSFASNLSLIESKSSPKSRISSVDGKKSLDLKVRHSCALGKVRNLQVQNQSSHAVHVTLSPPTCKEEDLLKIESRKPDALRLQAQKTEEESKTSTGRNRPSFQIFTQRKSKIRLLSPTNNPNPIISDKNSLSSSTSIEPNLSKKNTSTRVAHVYETNQSMQLQLQLQQQNSNSLGDGPASRDQEQGRASSGNCDAMHKGDEKAVHDTFCDRVKQNIITNGIGHLKMSLDSQNSLKKQGSPRLRQDQHSDDSHTITTSLETAATAHALRDRANNQLFTIGLVRSGGKLLELTEQAKSVGPDPVLHLSPEHLFEKALPHQPCNPLSIAASR